MRERPLDHPRETNVHHRGEYLSATDRVEACDLEDGDEAAPRRHLGQDLVQWRLQPLDRD